MRFTDLCFTVDKYDIHEHSGKIKTYESSINEVWGAMDDMFVGDSIAEIFEELIWQLRDVYGMNCLDTEFVNNELFVYCGEPSPENLQEKYYDFWLYNEETEETVLIDKP